MTATTTAPATPAKGPLGKEIGKPVERDLNGQTVTIHAHKHAGHYARKGGRRCVIREATGRILFDTGEQYDAGNAEHAVNNWLAEQSVG